MLDVSGRRLAISSNCPGRAAQLSLRYGSIRSTLCAAELAHGACGLTTCVKLRSTTCVKLRSTNCVELRSTNCVELRSTNCVELRAPCARMCL